MLAHSPLLEAANGGGDEVAEPSFFERAKQRAAKALDEYQAARQLAAAAEFESEQAKVAAGMVVGIYRSVQRVCVRSGLQLGTAKVGFVPAGRKIKALEVGLAADGRRRVRFSRGWVSLFAASGVKLLQEEDGTRASLHFHTEPSPAPSHSDDASEVPAAATAEKCSAVESTADSLTAQCLSAVVPSAAAAAAVAARRHQHQFAGPDTDGEVERWWPQCRPLELDPDPQPAAEPSTAPAASRLRATGSADVAESPEPKSPAWVDLAAGPATWSHPGDHSHLLAAAAVAAAAGPGTGRSEASSLASSVFSEPPTDRSEIPASSSSYLESWFGNSSVTEERPGEEEEEDEDDDFDFVLLEGEGCDDRDGDDWEIVIGQCE